MGELVGVWTVRRKLLAGFVGTAVLVAVVGSVGWLSMGTATERFEDLLHHDMAMLLELNKADRMLARLRINAFQRTLAPSAEARAKLKANEGEWLQALDGSIKAVEGMATSEQDRALVKGWREAYAAYIPVRERTFTLLDEDKRQESDELRVTQATPLGNKVLSLLGELVTRQEKAIAEAEQRFLAGAGWSRQVLLLVSIAALIIAVACGLALARFIARALAEVVGKARQAATGDLTVRAEVGSDDELGQLAGALNEMLEHFGDIVGLVQANALHLSSAARQLAAGSEQLSSGAQDQASSLEETAASLEQITGTVKQNADNAKQASQLAMGSRDTAEQGGQVVTAAVEAMDGINRASKKIAAIITTIDEIAFQTNLLALNAAVEAARAGEQGRGFAVVASEVRNLAQRSASAAKEIKGLIEDSVQKVDGGSKLVNQSGETLTGIVTSVKRVTDIIAEIAAASQEQTTGIDQVNRAVTQMDHVVQSNAAQTEELSSTAQSLAAQAGELQTLVARFKVDDHARPEARDRVMAAAPATKALPQAMSAGRHAGTERRAAQMPLRRRKTDAPLTAASAPRERAATRHTRDDFEEF